MTSLRIESSCEISNLIDVVCNHTKKPYNEVEQAFFELYLYPEGRKTAVGIDCTSKGSHWLYQAIHEIMYQYNIKSMYITEEI